MAKQQAPAVRIDGRGEDRVVALARDIYLQRLSAPAYQAKTAEFRVEEAFRDSEAFWAEADKRN